MFVCDWRARLLQARSRTSRGRCGGRTRDTILIKDKDHFTHRSAECRGANPCASQQIPVVTLPPMTVEQPWPSTAVEPTVLHRDSCFGSPIKCPMVRTAQAADHRRQPSHSGDGERDRDLQGYGLSLGHQRPDGGARDPESSAAGARDWLMCACQTWTALARPLVARMAPSA
jgi:hypothetical protein